MTRMSSKDSGLRRIVMTAALLSVLAGPAAAAQATAAEQSATVTATASVEYCGYDNRRIPPTISYGSQGNTVREAQCLLRDWDYYLGPTGVDGDFGTYTRSAVRQFQKDFGVAGGVDGIVGPKTWDALRTYIRP
jgi:peptidoglycan hydrolase-like protein with peptidoglycan-binding domain